MTILWTKVSGPGSVVFADATSPTTTVTFSTGGVYVLRLTADEGNGPLSDDVEIAVSCALGSATSAQIIYAALRLCVLGLTRAGRGPSTEQLTDGLARLNDMLTTWALEDLLIYTIDRTVQDLDAGTANYTIGDGGDIDIPRPDWILGANLILDANAVPTTETEIDVFTDQEWEGVPQKDLTNTLVRGIYYDHGWSAGLGRVYVSPVPTIGTTQLVLYSLRAISAFTDLTTCRAFPPGYAELLRYELALRLAPEFGGLKDPALARDLATAALARVKKSNIRPVEAMLDWRVPGRGASVQEARG